MLEVISFLLSIIALILVAVLLLLQLYFKIRKCFPTYVNCWFCNSWTWVPYDNWNSYECPNCTQYNGFGEDGGYNKVIQAQHKYTKLSPSKSYGYSNGLCKNCNRNQQLKIIQLAKFTPLVEENYDEEIEHFRKQLEMAYELCPPCKRILRTTLLKEKTTFLVNHVINIRRNGVDIYQKLKQKSLAIRSGLALVQLLKCVQDILALWVIFTVTSGVIKRLQPEWFSSSLLPYFESSLEIYKFFPSVVLSSADVGYKLFNGIYLGVLIQLPLYFLEETLMCIKVNRLLCWCFLALTSWNIKEELLINSFEIVCGIIIFYSSFVGFRTSLPNKATMKKLNSHQCYNDKYDEDFDTEDLKLSRPEEKMIHTEAPHLTDSNLNGRRILNVRCDIKTTDLGESFHNFNMRKSIFNVTSGRSYMTDSSHRETIIPEGFWRNNNVNIMPVCPNRRNSFSKSLGVLPPINQNYSPILNNFQIQSQPSSIETSLSGDFERLSVSPNLYQIPSSSTPSSSDLSNFNYGLPRNS